MSDQPRKGRGAVLAVWLLVVVALVTLGLSSGQFKELLVEAIAKVRLSALLATLPGQAVALLLCAAALYALRPGVSYFGCLGSRVLRDAGSNLLLFLPGTGEAIGARALVLAGGGGRAAVTASALDKLAETAAQIPYIALAAYVLLHHWDGSLPAALSFRFSPSIVIAVGAVLAALVLVGIWLVRVNGGQAARVVARIRTEFRLIAGEFHRQKGGLPAAIALHFLAWMMGGVQIWMAARAFGLDLGLGEAIAMESAAYAGRAILFFIPAGLVTQEAGLIAAGLVFGVTAPQSLALGLVLRLRDLVFGLPLLLWPAYEYRRSG